MTSADLGSPVATSARRKIALRLLPIVFTMYIVNYLDRANISFAHTPMIQELNFTEQIYGFGAGIFFIGYLVFEIPGALIVEHFGARRWMARILISWGICSAAVGLVGTSPAIDAFLTRPHQFYLARFMLGLAEAGFYPGIIVYLTHWFSLPDRAGHERPHSGDPDCAGTRRGQFRPPSFGSIGSAIRAGGGCSSWRACRRWRWGCLPGFI